MSESPEKTHSLAEHREYIESTVKSLRTLKNIAGAMVILYMVFGVGQWFIEMGSHKQGQELPGIRDAMGTGFEAIVFTAGLAIFVAEFVHRLGQAMVKVIAELEDIV